MQSISTLSSPSSRPALKLGKLVILVGADSRHTQAHSRGTSRGIEESQAAPLALSGNRELLGHTNHLRKKTKKGDQ